MTDKGNTAASGNVSGNTDLLRLLPKSPERITQKELSDKLSEPKRSVRREVWELRRLGIPICSDGKGYFLPASDEDLKRFEARTKHRIRSAAISLTGVREELKRGGNEQEEI